MVAGFQNAEGSPFGFSKFATHSYKIHRIRKIRNFYQKKKDKQLLLYRLRRIYIIFSHSLETLDSVISRYPKEKPKSTKSIPHILLSPLTKTLRLKGVFIGTYPNSLRSFDLIRILSNNLNTVRTHKILTNPNNIYFGEYFFTLCLMLKFNHWLEEFTIAIQTESVYSPTFDFNKQPIHPM